MKALNDLGEVCACVGSYVEGWVRSNTAAQAEREANVRALLQP